MISGILINFAAFVAGWVVVDIVRALFKKIRTRKHADPSSRFTHEETDMMTEQNNNRDFKI